MEQKMKNVLFILSLLFYGIYLFGDYGLIFIENLSELLKRNNYNYSESFNIRDGVCPKCQTKSMVRIKYQLVNYDDIKDKDSIKVICGNGLAQWQCNKCNFES